MFNKRRCNFENNKKNRKKIILFLVNKVLKGTNPKYFNLKRKLLNRYGYNIGKGTKIVGPIECYGKLTIGKNCWIGKNLIINGNGTVIIGDNCDIAPEVTFLTGGHKIGNSKRRAGEGEIYKIRVNNGVWIGARSTILGNIVIKNSSVIGAGALVNKNIEGNILVGGVPAKKIKNLNIK